MKIEGRRRAKKKKQIILITYELEATNRTELRIRLTVNGDEMKKINWLTRCKKRKKGKQSTNVFLPNEWLNTIL